jgi:excisionase family DNA binding protein
MSTAFQNFTIKEACELARCGKSTLYKAIKAGKLTARKLGRKTLIRDCELKQWIEELPVLQ